MRPARRDATDGAWSSSPRTVNEVAFDRLRELISSGEIEMGSRLDERTLSDRIGVSRTPLRDAIGHLVALGVAEHRVYRGTFLRSFTPKQVTELYEVRTALEGLAAYTAAGSAEPADCDRLEAIIERGTDAFERVDLTAFERADREFHALVAELSGNDLLVEELDRLALRIQLVRRIANLEATVAAETIGDRREVLDAIRRRDPAAARAAMARHIGAVQDVAVRRLIARD
ncbi:GntR family transcriptional regulator [Agromyces sp. GXQ0307]|uniref:GntR family transcriptional regulator n=1 Tax=Agromyces sp. GXQ0307 TaxID=3377835 RepID=UPI00383B2F11